MPHAWEPSYSHNAARPAAHRSSDITSLTLIPLNAFQRPGCCVARCLYQPPNYFFGSSFRLRFITALITHQLHPAVFGPALLGGIGRDRSRKGYPDRQETVLLDRIFGQQRCHDRLRTALREVLVERK